MTPSPEQSSIYEWAQSASGNALIVASAGSGKTTTIVATAQLISPYGNNKFFAFNKNIATELESRLPAHCSASTFHSAGVAALRRHFGKTPRIDGSKLRTLSRKAFSKKELDTYGGALPRLVSFAKNAGIGALVSDTLLEYLELIRWFNLSHDGDDNELARLAQRLLEISNNEVGVIDFDDMLYLPLLRKTVFDKCSWIFVDEAQDTNNVQRALLRNMCGTATRLVAVGDPSQAIYGFRGASSDAMTLLRNEFAMTVLPLSISYRCSIAVVKEAQLYDRGLKL